MTWRSYLIIAFIIFLCAFIGWEVGTLTPAEKKARPRDERASNSHPPQRQFTPQKTEHSFTPGKPTPPNALPQERIIQFPSEESLARFLALAKEHGIEIISGNQKRKTVRVKYDDLATLDSITPSDAETFFNFLAFPPIVEDGDINPNAVGFFGRIKELMGITEDNAAWGEGVKVAVIDTGIMSHEIFSKNTTALSLVDTGGKTPHPHGTAMASLWRDGDGRLPAIAPAVDLVSIQVSDTSGTSNLYTISEAIFLAADGGADLVTISMSSLGTNTYLGQAIQYAKEKGTLVIASAGNNGDALEVYPAAHPDVLAITSIDGSGNYPGFANTGDFISFSAPGVAVPAAGPEDTYTYSTGTSPAAQIGAATIAIAMSELGISDPYEASELVMENLNERGLPGDDEIYGAGFPQLDVILNHDVPGLYDGAIASNLLELDTANNSAQVQVVVDNPGTETLTDASLKITAQGRTYEAPLPSIPAKESYLYDLPISVSLGTETISVNSSIKLGNGLQDIRPQDNSQNSNFSLKEEP